MHNELFIQLYFLKEPFFSDCKKLTDSLKKRSEKSDDNFCIVHLKSCLGNPKIPVYFNDSLTTIIPKMFYGINPWVLIAFCPITAIFEAKEIKKWKVRKNEIVKNGEVVYHPVNLKFNNSGTLTIKDKKAKTGSRVVNIERGHEYYFYIFFSQGRNSFGPYLRQVTEEEYKLDELEY